MVLIKMVMVKVLQKIGYTVSTRIILKENVSIFLNNCLT